ASLSPLYSSGSRNICSARSFICSLSDFLRTCGSADGAVILAGRNVSRPEFNDWNGVFSEDSMSRNGEAGARTSFKLEETTSDFGAEKMMAVPLEPEAGAAGVSSARANVALLKPSNTTNIVDFPKAAFISAHPTAAFRYRQKAISAL